MIYIVVAAFTIDRSLQDYLLASKAKNMQLVFVSIIRFTIARYLSARLKRLDDFRILLSLVENVKEDFVGGC